MAHRITKRIACAVILLATLVIIVLGFFDIRRMMRENSSAADIAPSGGHFVQAGDVKIFIQETGPTQGRPVILVHGTGTWSEVWRETMEPLAQAGFRVIAIDLPPFGYSDKPDGTAMYTRQKQAERLLGLLDTLHVGQAIFVGHSVGARPVLELALRAPIRVSRLILVDPALGFQTDKSALPHFEQNKPSWIVRAFFGWHVFRNAVLSAYGTNPASIRSLLSSFVSNKKALTPQRISTIKKPMVMRGTTEAYGNWLENLVVSPDTSLGSDFTNFSKLSMPVFIIWGDADTTTPLWQGKALHDLISRSMLEVISGVGHIPYLEDVNAFNKVLLENLRK